jgi:hypothetical protein
VRLPRALWARLPLLAVITAALLIAGISLWWAHAASGGSAPSGRSVAATHPVLLNSPRSIYWGADIKNSDGLAPWDPAALKRFEQHVHKAISIISWGTLFYSKSGCRGYCGFETKQFERERRGGVISMFTWGPAAPGEPGWRFDAQIASGAEDAYLRRWAEDAKLWGHPFFLRFAWEMNGSWYPWGANSHGNTAADFVAMWRHVHDIFTQVGATNATWVWCPNLNGPNTYQPLAQLYPGNAYVDWTCLDGYNGDDPWLSFGDLYGPSYDQITQQIAPSKPFMLGEVSSTEVGGSKAAWISNMFTVIPTLFPKLRALVWYDSNDVGPGNRTDWEVESSPSATSAFAEGISSPIYVTNRYAHLDTSPIPPPGQ